MNKRRKALRIFSALFVLGSLFLSGMAGTVRAQRPHDNITLTFWIWNDDPLNHQLIEPYFRQFEKIHPGITVKWVAVSDANNWVKYTTAIAAGRGPDVILTENFNPPIPEFAANQLIQPLDPWFKQLNISQNQWLPWVWKMQNFHGRVWGFVQEYDTTLFTWNKDAFKAAGLDPNRPPRTIAELEADNKKLTKFDTKGNLIQTGIIPWQSNASDPRYWAALFGGSLYDPDHRQYTLNAPANVAALDWIGKIAKADGGAAKVNALLSQFSGNADPFYTGKVAMEVVGDWFPPQVFGRYAPKSLHYGVAQAPTAPGVPYGTNIVIGSDTFVMPVGAKHPLESAELMLYMMRAAPVLKWSIGESNVPPTVAGVFDPSYVKAVPFMSAAVHTAQMAIKNPNVLRPYPTSSVFDYVSGQYTTAMQQVEFGKMTAKQALDGVQKVALDYVAKAKRENPDWYGGGD
jgi:ABC-type glycerol-3-phosphate transport system substrate-binding protein